MATDTWDGWFEPYALALGYLLRDWNDLQDQLAILFVTITAHCKPDIPQAAWGAVPNDRMQRAMLLAVAKVCFTPSDSPLVPQHSNEADAAILKEISWIVEKSDNTGRQRDDAAHAPLALLLELTEDGKTEGAQFIAHTDQGHPLAEKLKDKNVLAEYQYYRERMVVLRKYAHQIEQYLRYQRSWPFPKRPELPSPPQSLTHTGEKDQGTG
jgi:hypothetical protein